MGETTCKDSSFSGVQEKAGLKEDLRSMKYFKKLLQLVNKYYGLSVIVSENRVVIKIHRVSVLGV